ncbi:MAG TPA: hypothetical protein VFT45_08850 [Longimicrobium sp.]|nr:hypothetical protein [Longimicrobium sp.]
MSLRPRLAIGVHVSANRARLALRPPGEGTGEVVFPAASLEAEVCRACDGERTLAEIAAALSAAGETGEGGAARRVLATFHALVERGLCEPVNAPPE